MFELDKVRYKDILSIDRLVIPKGRITSIVGESGSGKTTLLKLLNKLISPDYGQILFGGSPVSEVDAVDLRRRVVMLPQNPAIFPGTVLDNLAIGLKFSEKPVPGDDELTQVLKSVRLRKKLDEDAEKLSGGEKQRLALGRVILMDPEVFLLDEPSSSLDEATEQLIIEEMVSHIRDTGKTLVMVTHSKRVANTFSDYLVTIKAGRIHNEQEV